MDRNYTRTETGSGKPASVRAAEVLIQQIGQHGSSLRVFRPFYANIEPVRLSQTAPALRMTLFGYQDWQAEAFLFAIGGLVKEVSLKS